MKEWRVIMLRSVETDAGKRIFEIGPETGLCAFEENILKLGSCGALLPCMVITTEKGRLSQYDATGHLPFPAYPFRHIDQVLKVLHMIPVLLIDAEDCLLAADKFDMEAETLFVGAGTGEPRLIYGGAERGRTPFREQYAKLLSAAAGMEHITGLATAAGQILERIRLENPDLRGLTRIVETLRREWNYIQPEF
jgi:hypothetical protein